MSRLSLRNTVNTEGRVQYKGQVFSAPMDWHCMIEQLEDMEKQDKLISVPVTGQVLAQRVKLAITAGLTDLNQLVRQATIRRNIVVQLIRMHRDSGNPDYQRVDMKTVERQAKELAKGRDGKPTEDPVIPAEILDFLEEKPEDEPYLGVDKAATPAERTHSERQLQRNMERARPLILVAQRDSDANKDVEASRMNAFSEFATLEVRTGSNLEPQFDTPYFARMFNITMPRCVGGPDFPKIRRYRRTEPDAPSLVLTAFAAMMASRCEAQIGHDWDFNPAVQSLVFASNVNQQVGMSISRALRRGADDGKVVRNIGKSTTRIVELLRTGEYLDEGGIRRPANGDISKITRLVGLDDTERALVQNYNFMSSRIAGTRQIRSTIRHIVFSSRVVYGTPVFMTVTPGERHSGLAVRLFRGRRNDPAYKFGSPDFLPYVGYDSPSLCGPSESEPEEATFDIADDLPDYDLRRLITARDPLCCVNAFLVACMVELPLLYGFRMCPKCPQCAECEEPCMDAFGSNATPMGGGAGRCDAMVGAVEAQKAEGVLHLHMFLFLQMVHQFTPLQELADLIRAGILSSQSWKNYISHVRCASYPDAEQAEADRDYVERSWPAFAKDKSLSRLTLDLWISTEGATSPDLFEPHFVVAAWCKDGEEWHAKYNTRLQHALFT